MGGVPGQADLVQSMLMVADFVGAHLFDKGGMLTPFVHFFFQKYLRNKKKKEEKVMVKKCYIIVYTWEIQALTKTDMSGVVTSPL